MNLVCAHLDNKSSMTSTGTVDMIFGLGWVRLFDKGALFNNKGAGRVRLFEKCYYLRECV